jgi:hypothetical protein
MKPCVTHYYRDYQGENAHPDLTKDFYELVSQIDDLGIPSRTPETHPEFERDKNGKNLVAQELVLLAFENPLAGVYLKGVKWEDKIEGLPRASLSLRIRHFKGLEARFPRLEELAKQFSLTSKGTHQYSSG